MTENDLEEVTYAFIKAYAESPWNEEWSFRKAYGRINDLFNIANSVCVVCTEGNRIVGAVFSLIIPWTIGYQLEIRDFFVDSNHHNKGIGSFILDQLSSYCDIKERLEVVLYTKRVPKLQHFYEKNGFSLNNDTIYYSKVISKEENNNETVSCLGE